MTILILPGDGGRCFRAEAVPTFGLTTKFYHPKKTEDYYGKQVIDQEIRNGSVDLQRFFQTLGIIIRF